MDYLSCGICFITFRLSDIMSFIEHKKSSCFIGSNIIDSKSQGEVGFFNYFENPNLLVDKLLECTRCFRKFDDAMALLMHVQIEHQLLIVKAKFKDNHLYLTKNVNEHVSINENSSYLNQDFRSMDNYLTSNQVKDTNKYNYDALNSELNKDMYKNVTNSFTQTEVSCTNHVLSYRKRRYNECFENSNLCLHNESFDQNFDEFSKKPFELFKCFGEYQSNLKLPVEKFINKSMDEYSTKTVCHDLSHAKQIVLCSCTLSASTQVNKTETDVINSTCCPCLPMGKPEVISFGVQTDFDPLFSYSDYEDLAMLLTSPNHETTEDYDLKSVQNNQAVQNENLNSRLREVNEKFDQATNTIVKTNDFSCLFKLPALINNNSSNSSSIIDTCDVGDMSCSSNSDVLLDFKQTNRLSDTSNINIKYCNINSQGLLADSTNLNVENKFNNVDFIGKTFKKCIINSGVLDNSNIKEANQNLKFIDSNVAMSHIVSFDLNKTQKKSNFDSDYWLSNKPSISKSDQTSIISLVNNKEVANSNYTCDKEKDMFIANTVHTTNSLSINCGDQRVQSSIVASINFPYICQQCGLDFRQKIHLRKHVMVHHTKQKPFKCLYCDYETVEKSHLTVHIRVHTGERPFKCRECHYSSAQNCTLKSHYLRKHPQSFITCNMCGSNTLFLTELELEKHKRMCFS